MNEKLGSPEDSQHPVSKQKTSCCSPAAAHDQTKPAISAPVIHSPNLTKISPPLHNENMVPLPGGTFRMGTDTKDGFPLDGEGPIRSVTVDPFQIDRFPVTNAEFHSFANATGYLTEAERFGWSFVFWSLIPADRRDELIQDTVAAAPWWCKVNGANWKTPEGLGSDIANRLDHPVVHVSWNDGLSYAKWANKRLPTEAEWEYAARGGLDQKLYPWGNELTPNGKHMCNIWQGEFPNLDTAEDGYSGTSPVDAFPANRYGLYSMAGNTWEWCVDWFESSRRSEEISLNPSGPQHGQTKTMKGGSFLCHRSYCNRYRVAARTSNTPDSSSSNIGFRCAKNI